jgi:hypothetical protein
VKCLWLALYERVEALTWVGRASTRDHQHARACQWLPQHSPPQPNPVGTLALTKKSRTGILALISMLSEERVDAPIFAGRSVHSDQQDTKQSVAGEPAAQDRPATGRKFKPMVPVATCDEQTFLPNGTLWNVEQATLVSRF